MDAHSSEPVFDAVLYPHRSLGPRGVKLLLAGLAGAIALVALVFAAAGAWPVLPFFGCEIVLLWWALRANARDARAFERLHLTHDALTVARVLPSGRTRTERFAPPHWLSVDLTPRPGGDNELWLASHGRRLRIAGFLTPAERRELAAALRDALRRLRAPRG
jgi:uncharacterized membrane protein